MDLLFCLLILFFLVEICIIYVYTRAVNTITENSYVNVELTSTNLTEKKIEGEELKAMRNGQILIPEPEITLYYEI